MAEPIAVASIIIGTIFGAIGTSFGIYNFVKAFMKKPIPIFIEPNFVNTTPSKNQIRTHYTLRIDFELRNNGDKVSRLYYNSIMQFFDKDENKLDEDIRPLINDKEIGIEKTDLPPHSINPKGYSHYFNIATENHEYGLLYFKGYYFNHRNKKKFILQIFKFEKDGKTFKVDEIIIKKNEREAELQKLPI